MSCRWCLGFYEHDKGTAFVALVRSRVGLVDGALPPLQGGQVGDHGPRSKPGEQRIAALWFTVTGSHSSKAVSKTSRIGISAIGI
jgi:hypothetical protein